MLKIKDMNLNNVIRQGDTQPREYQLDTGNLDLNLTNKSATIRLMTADFQGIGYETTATVSSENKISFSIDDVIPARQYRLEVTVDDYVFPSRATDGQFDIDPSSHGQESNIIQIIGKDEIVREVKEQIDSELEPFLGEIEQAELDRQAQEEAREETHEKVKDLPEAFQNIIDETTGKDVISAPEIIAARRGKDSLGDKIDELDFGKIDKDKGAVTSADLSQEVRDMMTGGDGSVEVEQARVDASGNTNATLKERLDKEHTEVTSQLAEMVNIDIAKFGGVADANYLNSDDNRYYKDKNLTIPATDNAGIFQNIINFMNNENTLHETKRFTVLFPRGAMYSSEPLNLIGEYLRVIGNNSKLIVSVENSSVKYDKLCIYVRGCREFSMEGMTIENKIEDKSVVYTGSGRYYHLWIKGGEDVKLEYCHIHNNTFVDDVSTPNATMKPYNGTIWLEYAKNIFIHDNVFENVCGRIVYLFECEKAFIRNNTMSNVGYQHPEITNTNVGTIAVRLLTCKDVVVSDNMIEFTDQPYDAPEIAGVILGSSSSSPTTPCENISIKNNSFILHNSLTTAILCNYAIHSKISGNTFILNDKGKWVTFRFRSNDELVDLDIENNTIISPPIENQIHLDMPNGLDVSKRSVIFKDNRFKSDKLIKKISEFANTITLSSFRFEGRNSFYQNGSFKFDYESTNIIDYNQKPFTEVVINDNNVSELIIDGVLNVPENTGLVRITSGNITISDIKFNGNDLDRKKITIFNAIGFDTTIVYSPGRMRLVGLEDLVIKPFESVTLELFGTLWYME